MKLLRTYIKENIGTSLLGAIFLTLNTFATLAIPFQVSNMINHGIIKKNIDMVYSTSIKMIAILIFGTVTGIIANHYIALFAARFAKQNRKMLMRNIENLTLDQVSDFGVASLVTHVANDNNNAQQLIVAFFQMILPSPIMAILSIFLTIQLSPSLALIPLFTILIFAFAITLTLFKSLPYILKVQKKLDRMVLVLRERFIGAKIIRAFDNSKKERDKFNDIAQDYTDNYITINKKFALLSPMAFSLMSVIITLIIFFGARKVLNNTLEIGSITAIVEYSLTTIAALIMSSMVLVQMPKAVVLIDRIKEVLAVTSENGMISQGQQQLLTIAHTILPNPKVMILDEAISSINTKTEKDIQAVISQLMKGRTSFVIAHRLSTIRNADLILVMKDGDIVEQGNHDELMKFDEIYANLYNTQFNQ